MAHPFAQNTWFQYNRLMIWRFLFLFSFSPPLFSDALDPVKVVGTWVGRHAKGIELQLGFHIEERGFRVYKDSVRVVVRASELVDNELPNGLLRFDPILKKEKEIYDETVRWLIRVKPVDPTASRVEVGLTYRACNDQICHFPKTKWIKIRSDKKEVRADIFGSIGQLLGLATNADTETTKEMATKNIWIAILLCFVSGILTSLTPCVYPMIPITINIFGRVNAASLSASGKFNIRAFRAAGVYVAGMCFTYSVLGLLSGLTGSLFGRLLQSGFALGFLTLLFVTLSLGQLGLFKMTLPSSWQTKLSSLGHTENSVGIFLMGLFGGLIVSPCVGPVLAGILAFVFETSNAWLGLIYFFSFSLGLGILFLLIGGFSGMLAALPRSGPWMERVNRILAMCLLIAAAYYGVLWMKQTGLIQRSKHVSGETQIAWHTDEQRAFEIARNKKLPLIVDFTAQWCEACHVLENTVYKDPEVVQKIAPIVALRIDVTKETEGNQKKLRQFGVLSLPAVVFMDRSGNILEQPRFFGIFTAEDLLAALEKL